MIYVSIGAKSFAACRQVLKRVECAEIRLDLIKLSQVQVRTLFATPNKKLIATCRLGQLPQALCKELLLSAIESGASFVDLELSAPASFRRAIMAEARKHGCKVIISFHDYRRTPAKRDLERIVRKCFAQGADLAKIACQVNSARDNARLLGLLDSLDKLIVIGMGERGKLTRIVAPLIGSALTYAATHTGRGTAPGQITLASMQKSLRRLLR